MPSPSYTKNQFNLFIKSSNAWEKKNMYFYISEKPLFSVDGKSNTAGVMAEKSMLLLFFAFLYE